MAVSESHQQGGVGAGLPSSEVGHETRDNAWERHKWDTHGSVRVHVATGTAGSFAIADWLVGVWVKALLLVNGPETPKHSREEDQHAERGVQNHVGLPLVAHVTSSRDLEQSENVPSKQENVSVREVH